QHVVRRVAQVAPWGAALSNNRRSRSWGRSFLESCESLFLLPFLFRLGSLALFLFSAQRLLPRSLLLLFSRLPGFLLLRQALLFFLLIIFLSLLAVGHHLLHLIELSLAGFR